MTSNKTTCKSLLPVLLLVFSTMFLFSCGGGNPGDEWKTPETQAAEEKAGLMTGKLEKKPLVLKDCTTEAQYGYNPFEKRAFGSLVIQIDEVEASDTSENSLLSWFDAVSETGINEVYGDRLYVGHCTATIKYGNYNWGEGSFKGTLEYSEVGYWTRPEIDPERKCEYSINFFGSFNTGKVAEPDIAPAPGTKIRLIPTGKTTLNEIYTWANGERSNEDHSEREYAYVLDFTVAE